MKERGREGGMFVSKRERQTDRDRDYPSQVEKSLHWGPA